MMLRLKLGLLFALLSIHCWGSAPIRFLLTFDDGPSGSEFANPSAQVLATLANNSTQAGIKAIFFVQTRANRSGATEIGQQIMQREFAEGHILAFHTATPQHRSHRDLSDDELASALQNGSVDIARITGSAPQFVRPPFWSYDARTLAAYQQHGMQMLLTDLSAVDGKIWGVNFSLQKHRNLKQQLADLRPRWLAGELPVVDGYTPIVVTFHDLNRYTALVLDEYLQILCQVAAELAIPTASRAFYSDKAELERAALASTTHELARPQVISGFWNRLMQ